MDAKHLVLHVEDDPSDRLMTSHAFKKTAPRVEIQAAVDGEQALAYLSARTVKESRSGPLPLLVLLDLKLPKKTGFEVLEGIRNQPALRHLPVIILTSSREPGDIERAYNLGANSYIVKPIELEALRKITLGIGEYVGLLASTPEMLQVPLPAHLAHLGQ